MLSVLPFLALDSTSASALFLFLNLIIHASEFGELALLEDALLAMGDCNDLRLLPNIDLAVGVFLTAFVHVSMYLFDELGSFSDCGSEVAFLADEGIEELLFRIAFLDGSELVGNFPAVACCCFVAGIFVKATHNC